MKNLRTILVVAGLVYTLITIILMLNEEALYNNLNLLSLLDYFKYWMMLGLILLIGLIVVYSLLYRNLQKQYQRIEQENAAVKAHIYDIEQARRTEDVEAARRIESFRKSLDKGGRSTDPTPPQP